MDHCPLLRVTLLHENDDNRGNSTTTNSLVDLLAHVSQTIFLTIPSVYIAKVSASASTRPRPPISHETPVGAFPVAGVNIVDKKEPSTPSEITPSPITTTSKTAQSHMGGSGLSPGARPTSNGHSTPPQPLRFSFSMSPPAAAAEWKPTLSLDAISPGFSSSTLKTREFFPQPELHPYFFLESNYMIRASLPRSFYIIMAQHGIRHCCVFDFPVGNKWWSELSGMRKVRHAVQDNVIYFSKRSLTFLSILLFLGTEHIY